MRKASRYLIGLFIFSACVAMLMRCSGGSSSAEPNLSPRAALGEQLFSDVRFSRDRTQSCATCHNPDTAFIDPRPGWDGKTAQVSLGDDGVSLGDRNTPTAMYARFSPNFHAGAKPRFNSQQGDYTGFLGGQFLDGREPGLQGQAAQPPLNPVEMNLPDKAALVARIQEVPDYVSSFKAIYGDNIFDQTDAAYDAWTDSVAEFEKTEAFSPFSSKYDKSLRGEYTYSPLTKAAVGRALFFSRQSTNCATCHQLTANRSRQEVFTSFEYHNIGVPENTAARARNGQPEGFVDEGLLANPAVTAATEKGKFRVPTLRNSAVTGPYMHNGVFEDLRTVILFYDHFLTGSPNTTNPETGVPWGEPEVRDNLALAELQDGRLLSDEDVDALVCFIRSLTDERYEYLIPDDGLDCGL